MSKEFHSAPIRKLLKAAFDDEELNTFCYDHFFDVYERFASGIGRLVKIQLLIDYCKRHGKFDELLELIRQYNPHQYDKHLMVINDYERRLRVLDKNRGTLEVKLDGNFSSLSQEQLEIILNAFTGALAGTLNVQHKEITILEVRVGSIILKLQMPLDALVAIIELYEANAPVFGDLGIHKIGSITTRQVLWVDDYPFNNLYERRFLESLGIKFVISTSTEDALGKIEQDNYHAIISDMSRPPDGQAGYTLLKRIQELGVDIPFIIYSSSNDPKHKKEAREKGAFGNTASPYELYQVVLNALLSS